MPITRTRFYIVWNWGEISPKDIRGSIKWIIKNESDPDFTLACLVATNSRYM